MSEPRVLIVEDGDEYLENLSRFVPGPRYRQAHTGAEALRMLDEEDVDLVYLDMRFDRIPNSELLGDHVVATREHNGDPVRAWRYLQLNQGLYILDAMRRAGHGDLPVILAYDFSRQRRRLEHLSRIHPSLHWVPDAVTPGQIRALMDRLLA
jgi:CheY-like chemotaxis protein